MTKSDKPTTETMETAGQDTTATTEEVLQRATDATPDDTGQTSDSTGNADELRNASEMTAPAETVAKAENTDKQTAAEASAAPAANLASTEDAQNTDGQPTELVDDEDNIEDAEEEETPLTAEEAHGMGQTYFAQVQTALEEFPDGSWLGGEEHQIAFEAVSKAEAGLAPLLEEILRTEPKLVLRYEALRLAAHLELHEQLKQTLTDFLERAGFYPLMGRRIGMLLRHWETQPNEEAAQMHKGTGTLPPAIEASRARLHALLWFGPPAPDTTRIHTELAMLATQGEAGLFGIARLLREMLEEEYLMNQGSLVLFHLAAGLFVQHNYFEGVQVFFDFLADCKPQKPKAQARKTVGAVLKAVRTLRPYRYPQWALPLQRFVDHYKSIKRKGRAAEANMLIILITSSQLEEALLLEDDELVDLLRGRRDAAYTEQEFEAVAALCDELLAAGRDDCRIYHIRGWLAARIEGPDAAEPFFHQALNQDPTYVYSHLALASIYQLWGEDELYENHLAAACEAETTLISCQRKYGEVLQREGFIEEAILAYQRGLLVTPDQRDVLELEELFGCAAALASIYAEFGEYNKAIDALEQLEPPLIMDRFGARFSLRQSVIIDLLNKGILDFRVELLRDADLQELPSV